MANARTAKSAREKAAQMRAEAERAAARRRTILAAVLVVVAVVVVAGVVFLVNSLQGRTSKTPANFTANGFVYVPAASATPSSSASSSASASAPAKKVAVDVYEDFQCPICKEFEAAGGPTLTQYAAEGKIELRYHPVAILDRASSTEYSTRALNAWAAVLDTSPGSVQKFHDLLFANQPAENTAGLPDSQLVDLAVQAGASKSAVEPLITQKAFKNWTAAQTDTFSKKGYTGTPTVVVDGKQQDNNDPAKIKAAIDKALAG